MTRDPMLVIVAIGSTAIAVWLVAGLWRSGEPWFIKLSLTVVAFVPVFGPVMVLFHRVTPPVQPLALQDHAGKRTDVLDRWRPVFDAKSPVRRFRLWWWRVHDRENLQ
ncbi:hypothetical protein [Silanimonas algicola]